MKYTFKTYFDGSEIGKRTFDNVNDLYDYMMDYQFSKYAEQESTSIEDETGKVYTDTEIEDMVETEEETAEEEIGFKAKEGYSIWTVNPFKPFEKKPYVCSIYVKNGKKWDFDGARTDKVYVLGRLAEELIAKKVKASSYIRSIKRVNHYNGTQTITVMFDNGVKAVYDIPDTLY